MLHVLQVVVFAYLNRCYTDGEQGAGNERRERKNEKWEQNLTWTPTLSVTLFPILCFIPISYFPLSRARLLLRAPRF